MAGPRKDQVLEIRRRAGIPPERPEAVPIQVIRDVLHLDEIPLYHLLDSETWFVGGIVRRWLSGELHTGRPTSADFDLFFASRDAFIRSMQRMFALGFTVEAYRVHCGISLRSAFVKAPAGGWRGAEGFRHFHREIASLPSVAMVSVVSSEGHRIQPHPFWFRSRPDQLFPRIDFSISHFAMDDRQVYAGPHAWEDLVERRLRLQCSHFRTLRRFAKYLREGYRPSPATWLAVAAAPPVIAWKRLRGWPGQ